MVQHFSMCHGLTSGIKASGLKAAFSETVRTVGVSNIKKSKKKTGKPMHV